MSSLLKINDNIFVSVKEAAEYFGYSRDHITRLAKAKKIKAVLSGRVWLISQESLRNYYEDQKTESEIRKSLLSSERQAELHIRSRLTESSQCSFQAYEKSSLRASALACAFLGLCFFVASQMEVSSVSHKASTFSAIIVDSTIPTTESEFIQPVFTNGSEVSVSGVGRTVDRPVVTPQWVLINHD